MNKFGLISELADNGYQLDEYRKGRESMYVASSVTDGDVLTLCDYTERWLIDHAELAVKFRKEIS